MQVKSTRNKSCKTYTWRTEGRKIRKKETHKWIWLNGH